MVCLQILKPEEISTDFENFHFLQFLMSIFFIFETIKSYLENVATHL